MTHEATLAQIRAADPGQSTWLSANAGSGKTRVLTDRVARLLLGGVEPQRILCLTYTKAAASEMQNRLFRRLGEWAMLGDQPLQGALDAMGVPGPVTAEVLAKARRLFARAIETPGGLRIQTIHSFCSSLLRRFPLEAGVSPGFAEMDDRTARLLRDEIAEDLAQGRGRVQTEALARLWTGEDFGDLLAQIAGGRGGLDQPLDAAGARALFGLAPGEDAAGLVASVFLGGEAEWLEPVVAALAAGSANDQKAAAKLAQLRPKAPGLGDLVVLEGVLLTGATAKVPFAAKIGSFPTKATAAGLAALMPRLEALMRRVEAARERRIALMAAERTAVLHDYARVFLPEYAARKAARGWLDFDDLIRRTEQLLTDPSVAAWVLFRLDGGIDHILVDEAQDTAPEQWRVIELLAAEFTSGEGARGQDRTLFVVGDKKQSIYSFQGADVAAFDEKRAAFRDKLLAVERPFQALDLLYSFRSSPAVLGVVDATLAPFAGPALGGQVAHRAFKAAMPGRVDLWPLIEASDKPEDENWFDPVDLISDAHHAARLGREIAREIAAMIAAGVQIPTDAGPRPVHAGDFLVLVQRRSAIFAEVIRACKALGLPVAGADRLKLGAELAVKDLVALLSFLDTPEDDLSLAAVLRSPLCGWGEAALYSLAQGRPGFLWARLRERAAEHAETFAFLSDLRDQADFLRPYELIDRALTRHDKRRALIARLGDEAEDGIDELLNQALAYEVLAVPSLTGFLIWLGSDEIEVKRQTDSEGSRIRVMTVHGAKGLEAPVVILPDTADRKPQDRDELYTLADGTVVWKTPAEASPAAITEARAARREAEAAENLRLLYVAMTRARAWLIVCGAGEAKTEGAWHRLIGAGLQTAGVAPLAHGRLRHQQGDWPPDAPRPATTAAAGAGLPHWAGTPAPDLPEAPKPLSPSALGGAKALPGEGGAGGLDEEAAMARGHLLHLLLEALPAAPPRDWPALARAIIEDPPTRHELLDEAERVLGNADLQWLFAPGTLAEVPVVAPLQGRMMSGVIDRLVIGPDRVLAVDYKSNQIVPRRPEEVPEGLLRQMAAYAGALALIYPGRRIETALLWTRTAALMPLPPDIVRAAMQETTIP